jgi:phosphatidylglycerophosphate synthase
MTQSDNNMLWNRDAWYVVLIIDRLSVPITLRMARTRITPNQVTILSILGKLLAVLLIWTDQPWWSFVVWQIAFLLDCVDGPLARYTRKFSPYGELLDHGGDVGMQWAYTLSIAFHILYPVDRITFVLIIFWTLLWTLNWYLVERGDENIVSAGTVSSRKNPYLNSYIQWTGKHRMKLVPVTGIEEVTLILPLSYALGWLQVVVPVLFLYRLFAVVVRLAGMLRRSKYSTELNP